MNAPRKRTRDLLDGRWFYYVRAEPYRHPVLPRTAAQNLTVPTDVTGWQLHPTRVPARLLRRLNPDADPATFPPVVVPESRLHPPAE